MNITTVSVYLASSCLKDRSLNIVHSKLTRTLEILNFLSNLVRMISSLGLFAIIGGTIRRGTTRLSSDSPLCVFTLGIDTFILLFVSHF
jgi:hypothetical protein